VRTRDVLLALVVVLLWGLNFVVIKLGLRGVSPFVLAGLRFVFASFPAVLFVPRPRVPFRDLAAFALATFVGQFALLFWAIKLGMPSGLASLVLQSQVVFTLLLAAVVLREIPRRPQIVGVAAAALGLLWIGTGSGSTFPGSGFALTLCAAVAWAVGNLASRRLSRHGSVDGFAFVIWAGLIPPLPFFAMAWALEGKEAILDSVRAMDGGSWAAVLYLAYAATVIGYGLWNHLMKSHPAAQVTRFALLVPVVGLLSGALLVGERLTAAQLLGSALVVLGLALPLAAGRLASRGAAPERAGRATAAPRR
jgi:O-acetylserine/cysteine efflux transporter